MNQRLRLSYYDQNEKFASLLPCEGTTDRVVASDTQEDWTLFHLDHALEYEGETYEWLLLRSRWHGTPIAGPKPASVFIVLAPEIGGVRDGLDVRARRAVAWGMVEVIDD